MAMPASGSISLWDVNNQTGNGTGTRGLDWVSANTAYNFKDLNSIHGLAWFGAVSSKNSVSRTTTSTTLNCSQNCASQRDSYSFINNGNQTLNCYLIANTNCNQCGYGHGTYLQGNCNCNCNCYVCHCDYSNCNCALCTGD